ncbi:hypothetical protein BKA67DRAFT_522691 [Truncatella angustata]|uniref:Methyltransferase domain-containing protein n=1 Tax=Truncatella angustata TaxID=152316 RepID=A0A9P8ZUH0_9PEZI|nr:uncharacterized protein BKA67DRAFT_522691 [Truncatella angustata]KAH6649101.1 hypothetical protein BKA67DRAFT_522691 [Truncatella angustata]
MDDFPRKKRKISRAADAQATSGVDEPNGWNGTFVKASDPYALMRDCSSSARLTAQHYLWKDLLGFLVHPNIPTRASDLRIADIATGNGIWLCDYARNKPASVELHGFDVNLDQVGPKAWLPTNVHMHTWNMFEEPDPRFVGYFDIVHVKLITVVVKNNDPRPILANLTKMLKPGGHLQWDEVDTIGASIKTVPGVSASNLDTLFSQLRGCDTWKYELKQIMNHSGYTGSELYIYEYPLGMARYWNDVYVSAWKEFAGKQLQTPEISRNLELQGMRETRDGAAIYIPKLVWVAMKL